MNNTFVIKDIFARLFVIATQNKVDLSSFTYFLETSKFIQIIEDDRYDEYLNKPINKIYSDIVEIETKEDTSYGIYNDAYWCGASYFEIFMHTKKPFSYIFLKMPLETLISLYPVYHEMDLSSLFEYFESAEKKKTILRCLCEINKISLAKLSKVSEIPLPTLVKYNASDKALYKASFQTVMTLSCIFETNISLFREKIEPKRIYG